MGLFSRKSKRVEEERPWFYVCWMEGGEAQVSKRFGKYEDAESWAGENIASQFSIETLSCGNSARAKQILFAKAIRNQSSLSRISVSEEE
jgi:hypothetical protein